jgi:nitrite reductase (NADH) large subunit
MIIYSVGIRANKELLEGTPVKTNLGVLVNDRMETNIENIYAAGDVAEFNGRIGGLWNIAVEQGKTAGYNIAGREAAYIGLVTVTMMNAFNASLFSAGDIDENSCDKTLTDENPDKISYKRIFVRDNKIAGAIVIGDTRYSTLLKAAIENETVFSDMDLSNISVSDLLDKLKSK